jgi:hypothetical protein
MFRFSFVTLISLDASLRYPVTPDVSSRPDLQLCLPLELLFYVLILFPYLFSYIGGRKNDLVLSFKLVEFLLIYEKGSILSST